MFVHVTNNLFAFCWFLRASHFDDCWSLEFKLSQYFNPWNNRIHMWLYADVVWSRWNVFDPSGEVVNNSVVEDVFSWAPRIGKICALVGLQIIWQFFFLIVETSVWLTRDFDISMAHDPIVMIFSIWMMLRSCAFTRLTIHFFRDKLFVITSENGLVEYLTLVQCISLGIGHQPNCSKAFNRWHQQWSNIQILCIKWDMISLQDYVTAIWFARITLVPLGYRSTAAPPDPSDLWSLHD